MHCPNLRRRRHRGTGRAPAAKPADGRLSQASRHLPCTPGAALHLSFSSNTRLRFVNTAHKTCREIEASVVDLQKQARKPDIVSKGIFARKLLWNSRT